MDKYHTLTPQARREALISLEGHPGWRLYCDRADDLVKKQIDAKIFDLKTTDEDRRVLVAARQLLVDGHAPDAQRRSMISAEDNAIAREKKQAG